MYKSRLIATVLTLVLAVSAGPLWADDGSDALGTVDSQSSGSGKSHGKGGPIGGAGGNYTVGLGPIGNIYVVDSMPELEMGVGGYAFFDYRWSPQFSTQVSFFITDQDGKGASSGDNDIQLLGVPTFDLKFYILTNPSRWDPYGLIGVGFFVATEGSANNGSKCFGVGADIGLGTDFYISERFSVGAAAIFRSIGMIESTAGGRNGTSLFPFSMMGNVAYHW